MYTSTQYTRTHVHKYTSTQVHNYTTTQVHKYTITQEYKYKLTSMPLIHPPEALHHVELLLEVRPTDELAGPQHVLVSSLQGEGLSRFYKTEK